MGYGLIQLKPLAPLLSKLPSKPSECQSKGREHIELMQINPGNSDKIVLILLLNLLCNLKIIFLGDFYACKAVSAEIVFDSRQVLV